VLLLISQIFKYYYSTVSMRKQVYRLADIQSKVLNAVDTIADPVVGTMSPKGRNVIFEDEDHALFSTNDGVTIAKSIYVKDQIENAIIQMVKGASVKTNTEVGDGTSTSLLFIKVLMHECMKLRSSGMNGMEIKAELNKFMVKLLAALAKQKLTVKGDADIFNIAKVSANNDEEIATNVVKVIKTTGLDGMIFINGNNKQETELVEELGFQTDGGIFAPELANAGRFNAIYNDVAVLITDKRIYYPEEAETILTTAIQAGHKNLVVVARDFIGQAPNVFLANHGKHINVLLIKDNQVTDNNRESLQDLASYLGGEIVSEKLGSIVDNLSAEQFIIADKVWADPHKGIFSSKNPTNKEVKKTIASIRAELKKDKDNDFFKRRLASLTTGTVTINVGGATAIEVKERIYRYEDSISAARAALRDGYLVGGGVAMYRAFLSLNDLNPDFLPMYRKLCTANIRQIAENCGEYPNHILASIEKANHPTTGYNAVTGVIEDLNKTGVWDPYKVTEMAVTNSISIAGQIISSDFLIIEDEDETKDD
jgi:chaperonin GroEL